MKQFAVLGLGSFGYTVSVSLAQKGHEVLVIDINKNKIEEIKDLVTEAVVADLKNDEILKEHLNPNIETVIIDLGNTMEVNTLSIYYLKDQNVKNIIVKCNNQVQADIYKKIGATEIIEPEKVAGEHLAEKLSSKNLIDYIPFSDEYGIFEIKVPDKYVGQSISDVGYRKKYNIQIIALKEEDNTNIRYLPDPTQTIEKNSILLIMCKKEDFEKLDF